MSKIQETVSLIKLFLDSKDRSCTGAIRKAAAEYASAVNQLSKDLQECRELIDKGLYRDARISAKSHQPSLSERGKTLHLEKAPEWREICLKYGLPVPEEPDEEVLKFLSEEKPSEEDFSMLVTMWRKIARDGDPLTKARLLRKIIARASAKQKGVWRNNLINVERALIPWLLEQIKNSFEKKDYEGAQNGLAEIMSAEMITRPEESELAPLRSGFAEWQKEKSRQEGERLVGEIDSACMEQDQARLEPLMERWYAFSQNPLFEINDSIRLRIEDAEKWLKKCRSTEQINRQAKTLTLELRNMLSGEVPFPEIEKKHNELLSLSTEIDSVLEQQILSRKSNYQTQERRKHVRNCIYGFLCMILIVLGAAFTVHFIQIERDYNSTKEEIRSMLKRGNTGDIYKFYETLKKKDPDLARRPEICGLIVEARELDKINGKQSAEFNSLLEVFQSKLNSQEVEIPEMKGWLARLNALKPGRTRQQVEALIKAEQDYANCLAREKKKHNSNFLKTCSGIEKELERLRKLLADGNSDLSSMTAALLLTEQQIQNADRDYPKADNLLKVRELEKLRNRRKALEERYPAEIRKRDVLNAVEKPAAAVEYFAALKQIPAVVPEEYEKWKTAIRMLPVWEMLHTFRFSDDDLKDIRKFAELRQKAVMNAENPYTLVFELFPDPQEQKKKIRKIIDDVFENQLLKNCDLYEILFYDDLGNVYPFYSEKQPEITQRPRGVVRTVSIDVQLNQNEEARPFDLKAEWRGEKVRFIPGESDRNTFAGLPKYFTGASGADLEKGTFSKAAHHTFLSVMIKALRGCENDLEKLSGEAALQFQYLQKSGINLYMKRVIGLQLLKLIRTANPLADTADAENLLQSAVGNRAWNWRNPSETAVNPGETKSIRYAIEKTDMRKIMNKANLRYLLIRSFLSRRLEPAAILFQNKNGQVQCRMLTPSVPVEYWLISADPQAGGSVYVLPPDAFTKGFPADFRKEHYFFHGQVLFTPSDYRKTETVLKELLKDVKPGQITPDMWPKRWPVNKRGY